MQDWFQEFYDQEQFREFTLPQNEERGPGVMALHGFVGSPGELRPLSEELHKLGFTVEAPLMQNMGKNIKSLNESTAEGWKSDFLAKWRPFAESHNPRVLVGYSLGGAIALHAAAEIQPDLLILIAPHVRIAMPVARLLPVAKYVLKRVAPFANTDFDNPNVRTWFQRVMPGLDVSDPSVQHDLKNSFVYSTRMLEQLQKLSDTAADAARSVISPTVVLQGHADTITLPRHTRKLIDRLPNLQGYFEVPGNHMLPFPTFDSWLRVRRIIVDVCRPLVESSTPTESRV